MNLIDTHAHLYYDSFHPDFDQVIQRAKDKNLKAIINIGVDLESSKKSVELENNQIQFFSSIGLHPHEAFKLFTHESIHDNVEKLEQLYQSNMDKIIAIGECGLDYFQVADESSQIASSSSTNAQSPRNDTSIALSASVIAIPTSSREKQSQTKKLQKQLFQAQIALAKKLNLPLIIHCRPSTSSGPSAWEDIFIPELTGTTGVFHSFTGAEKEAKKVLDLGYYLGFSCIVTYPKNDHLREIIKWAPLNKILTETDCPFLPPQTKRGKRNEPSNISEVVKVIAEIKDLSQEKVSQAVWQNAVKLFNLPTNQPS